jgi:hypothetical protein
LMNSGLKMMAMFTHLKTKVRMAEIILKM